MTFKKGQSGNPKGRPKKVDDIGRYIRKRLSKLPKGKNKRYIYYLVTRLLNKGIADGDVQAIRELLDRAFGKSKQTIEAIINPREEMRKIDERIKSVWPELGDTTSKSQPPTSETTKDSPTG